MKTKKSYKKVAFILLIVLIATMIPIMSYADSHEDEGKTIEITFYDEHCHNYGSGSGSYYSKTITLTADANGMVTMPDLYDTALFDDYTACPKHDGCNMAKIPSGTEVEHIFTGWDTNQSQNNKEGHGGAYLFAAGEKVPYSDLTSKGKYKNLKAIFGETKMEEDPITSISAVKSSDPENGTTVSALEIIEYSIKVRNTGDTKLENVVIKDAIPDDTAYVPGSADKDGVFDGDEGDNGTVTWTIAEIATGSSVTVSFKVQVNEEFDEGTVIYNIAYYGIGEADKKTNDIEHPTEIIPVVEPDPEYVYVKYFANHIGAHDVNQDTYPAGLTNITGSYIKLTTSEAMDYLLENLNRFECDNDPDHYNQMWKESASTTQGISTLNGKVNLLDDFTPALFFGDNDTSPAYHIYGHWVSEITPPDPFVLVKYYANHDTHDDENLNIITMPDGNTGLETDYIKVPLSEAANYQLLPLSTFTCDGHENKIWKMKAADPEIDGIPTATIDLTAFEPADIVFINDIPTPVYNIYGHWGMVEGEISTPPPITPVVAGQQADPFVQTVLGEEAKTGDSMNIILIVFFILAAIAVAGGIFSRRKMLDNR